MRKFVEFEHFAEDKKITELIDCKHIVKVTIDDFPDGIDVAMAITYFYSGGNKETFTWSRTNKNDGIRAMAQTKAMIIQSD